MGCSDSLVDSEIGLGSGVPGVRGPWSLAWTKLCFFTAPWSVLDPKPIVAF